MNSLFSTDLALTPSNFVAGGNLFETVLESAQRQLQLSLSPSQGLGMADLGSHFRAKTGVDPSLTLFPGLDLSQGLSQTAVSRFAEEVNIFMPLRRSLSDFDALIGGLASRAAVDALLDPKRPSAARSESSDSSMALLAAPVDNAGNTLATARNIGTLSSSQSFSDFVGSTDTNDYYLFTLGQASNFSLTLNGLSADADVQLLNGSGNVLTISNRTGTQAESISQSLNAGTYYVRVFPFSTANTNYNLTLAAAPVDNAGNTLATARNIGTLSSSQSFSDFVGSTDTNDYYLFTLSQTSNFSLTLNGLSADADVQLLNGSGNVLTISNRTGTQAESISQSLNAGTYYVRVFPFSTANTNYNLTLAAASVAPAATLAIAPTNAIQAEGNSGSKAFTFTVTRSGNTTGVNAVTWAVAGSGTNPANASDFAGGILPGGTISFAAGETSKVITVNVQGDTTVEPDENFTVTLSSPTNGATLTTATATGTIQNDDTPPAATLAIAPTNAIQAEGNSGSKAFTFTVTRSGNTTGVNAVTWAVAGSGTNPANASDFAGGILPGGTISFAAGETSKVITVNVQGDTTVEPDENFTVTLSSPTNGATLTTATATGTIQNDDTPPPPSSFNSTYGYGLINAAAAVARALGQTSPFPDVANLGGNNWGNDLVKAPEVWAQGYTGQGIVVAVVDTGVDYTHSDLAANIWVNSREIPGNGIDDDGNGFIDDVRGWDFVNNDNTPLDGNGHGTHVAGTIAALNNGTGVTGVAYNARIMPVQVLSNSGSGSSLGVANGIRYAANNGARVINLSLGGGYSADIYSAIQYATGRGSIVVMAAGNEGAAQPGYPAFHATEYGLSIGAVDSNSRIASFSNRAGTNSAMRHVMAPGVGVYSTVPNNGYATYNGTSMATPHAAGVVALMLSANGGLSPAQVREMVTGTATYLV